MILHIGIYKTLMRKKPCKLWKIFEVKVQIVLENFWPSLIGKKFHGNFLNHFFSLNVTFFLFLFSLQTTADEYTLKESISNLTRRQYRRPFLILNFLFILMTFSGNFAITFYAVDIFQNVSPFVNEYLSAVIIGIIKFVGALLYIPAIKYVSRRILICGSAFVMGIRYVFLSKKKFGKGNINILYLPKYTL